MIAFIASKFTFHYAPIKTEVNNMNFKEYFLFTFHYASIKTQTIVVNKLDQKAFTFHYASIKTRLAKNKDLKIEKIYISLCFY